jgi:hypothetical protein
MTETKQEHWTTLWLGLDYRDDLAEDADTFKVVMDGFREEVPVEAIELVRERFHLPESTVVSTRILAEEIEPVPDHLREWADKRLVILVRCTWED